MHEGTKPDMVISSKSLKPNKEDFLVIKQIWNCNYGSFHKRELHCAMESKVRGHGHRWLSWNLKEE